MANRGRAGTSARPDAALKLSSGDAELSLGYAPSSVEACGWFGSSYPARSDLTGPAPGTIYRDQTSIAPPCGYLELAAVSPGNAGGCISAPHRVRLVSTTAEQSTTSRPQPPGLTPPPGANNRGLPWQVAVTAHSNGRCWRVQFRVRPISGPADSSNLQPTTHPSDHVG